MATLEEAFELVQTGHNTFEGKRPLTKPNPKSRGVYGGNLAGQAILAAARTIPTGFTPHSFHSLFVKNVSDQIPVTWEVDQDSNGRNFCCRTVRGIQDGRIKYIVDISFTKRNSVKEAEREHQNYLDRRRTKMAASEGTENVDEDDEDEDDDLAQKPFYFLTPYPEWLKNIDKSKMIHSTALGRRRFIEHLMPQQLLSLEGTKYEESIPASKRKLAFFVRLGDGTLKIDPAMQFAGLAVITDSLFLTKLARLLRISTVNLNEAAHYFSVSLDHNIYFHDTDFDCTEWIAFGFKALRLVNNRVLLEAELHNTAGQHIATVIQEGLVHLNGLEVNAKL